MASIKLNTAQQRQIDLLNSVLTDLNALKATVNQLISDHNAHVHGGITAGSANSAAPTATSAVAVAITTTA